jgi:hypothetical protein
MVIRKETMKFQICEVGFMCLQRILLGSSTLNLVLYHIYLCIMCSFSQNYSFLKLECVKYTRHKFREGKKVAFFFCTIDLLSDMIFLFLLHTFYLFILKHVMLEYLIFLIFQSENKGVCNTWVNTVKCLLIKMYEVNVIAYKYSSKQWRGNHFLFPQPNSNVPPMYRLFLLNDSVINWKKLNIYLLYVCRFSSCFLNWTFLFIPNLV